MPADLRSPRTLTILCRLRHVIYTGRHDTKGSREKLVEAWQGLCILPISSYKMKCSRLPSPKASTGDEQDDLKKPRRSQRISSQSQTTPLKDPKKSYLPSPLTHKESTATEEYKELTASPPEGRPSQINHRPPGSPLTNYTQGGLSSPPPSDTQAFSQFVIPPKTLSHEVEDEEEEGVWGYLVPVDAVFGDTLVLKNRSACPAPYPNVDFGKGTKKRAKGQKGVTSFVQEEKDYEIEKRTSGFPAGGYLIGRHPECGMLQYIRPIGMLLRR